MQFEPTEKWIWLDEKQYPENQTTAFSCMRGQDKSGLGKYTVVYFEREYRFEKPIKSVKIRTSGDTFFRLFLNGGYAVTGPASVGGDFLNNDRARPQFFATEAAFENEYSDFSDGNVKFGAFVRMGSDRMFEYSMGRGGFFLTAHIRFCDGTKTVVTTDESWNAQYLPSYVAADRFDARIETPPVSKARLTQNVWHTLTSPIPTATLNTHLLTPEHMIIEPKKTMEITLPLDMIYTGYASVDVFKADMLDIKLYCMETDGDGKSEHLTFTGEHRYISTRLCTAGRIRVVAENCGDESAEFSVSFIDCHYPAPTEAKTATSDSELDLVLRVCTHTLKYCRQTLHLDSGSHCEPLACTGDYYIESLMSAMTFGDMRLAAFDIRRTANLLRYNDGRMFHTTYSLIWVLMLWDVYMINAERAMLYDCEDALTLLLERFERYMGDNGIIENPPDYMFIDWLIPDGISTHHPPKALGQTCLNLFYYGALQTASKVYGEIGEHAMAEKARVKAEALRKNIISLLYDTEKGLFFEGLNTPTDERLVCQWMPQNVEKRYYRKHANILAAYFGVLDKDGCRALIEKIMNADDIGQVQPYFAHFMLEAIYRNGLRDKYTLAVLEEWKEPVKECPYGLAEGFYKPEPTYSFDHSHAWGGTPSYALPLALTGLKILEAGYKKISLSPSLLGLEYARTEIPTPLGNIVVDQKKGSEPKIEIPNGIELV